MIIISQMRWMVMDRVDGGDNGGDDGGGDGGGRDDDRRYFPLIFLLCASYFSLSLIFLLFFKIFLEE